MSNWMIEKALFHIRRIQDNNHNLVNAATIDTGYGRKYLIPNLFKVIK